MKAGGRTATLCVALVSLGVGARRGHTSSNSTPAPSTIASTSGLYGSLGTGNGSSSSSPAYGSGIGASPIPDTVAPSRQVTAHTGTVTATRCRTPTSRRQARRQEPPLSAATAATASASITRERAPSTAVYPVGVREVGQACQTGANPMSGATGVLLERQATPSKRESDR
jgi:hypothetical protein